MTDSHPHLRYAVAGLLRRETILTSSGKACVDLPGGSALYCAAGVAVWDHNIGVVARVGSDYPPDWLQLIQSRGLDTSGIQVDDAPVDLRYYVAYLENGAHDTENPVANFARLNLPYPRSLLGYLPSRPAPAVRGAPDPLAIQLSAIPDSYLDVTAAHICALPPSSQFTLLSAFSQRHVQTITLEITDEQLNPAALDNLVGIINGLNTVFISEQGARALFSGRTTDPWEMMETLSSLGCEAVVMLRAEQGLWVFDHAARSRWLVPAYPARPVDPTGSREALFGGYLAGYRSVYDPLEAALHGSISASLVMEGSGAFFALDALPGLAAARLEALRPSVRKL